MQEIREELAKPDGGDAAMNAARMRLVWSVAALFVVAEMVGVPALHGWHRLAYAVACAAIGVLITTVLLQRTT